MGAVHERSVSVIASRLSLSLPRAGINPHHHPHPHPPGCWTCANRAPLAPCPTCPPRPRYSRHRDHQTATFGRISISSAQRAPIEPAHSMLDPRPRFMTPETQIAGIQVGDSLGPRLPGLLRSSHSHGASRRWARSRVAAGMPIRRNGLNRGWIRAGPNQGRAGSGDRAG